MPISVMIRYEEFEGLMNDENDQLDAENDVICFLTDDSRHPQPYRAFYSLPTDRWIDDAIPWILQSGLLAALERDNPSEDFVIFALDQMAEIADELYSDFDFGGEESKQAFQRIYIRLLALLENPKLNRKRLETRTASLIRTGLHYSRTG